MSGNLRIYAGKNPVMTDILRQLVGTRVEIQAVRGDEVTGILAEVTDKECRVIDSQGRERSVPREGVAVVSDLGGERPAA